jgi:acyl carrier protein
MSSDAALGVVKAWVLEQHPGLEDIPVDVDLLTERLVDSLAFIDLVELLSELTGQDIDVSTLEAESIQTLAAIQRNFLAVLDS